MHRRGKQRCKQAKLAATRAQYRLIRLAAKATIVPDGETLVLPYPDRPSFSNAEAQFVRSLIIPAAPAGKPHGQTRPSPHSITAKRALAMLITPRIDGECR
jgi:hypothetical protein